MSAVVLTAGACALLAGTVTFLGWWLDIYRLTDWNNSGISMKTNPAICSIAAGVALIVSQFASGSRAARAIVAMLGALVALIGGLTLLQHITGWNIGIDTLLFDEPPGARATFALNRMGIPASTAFLLIGAALVLLQGGFRSRGVAAGLGVAVLAITMLALTGYLYGAEETYVLRLTSIALQTVSILLALGLAIIASVPEREPMRMLANPGAAGLLVRRALPIIILLSLTLGWLRIFIQEQGYVDMALGTALRSIVEIFLLTAALWWVAAVLTAHERRKEASDEQLKLAWDEIEATYDQSPIGMLQLDTELRCVRINETLARMDGVAAVDHIGKTLREIVPDLAPKSEASFREVIETGQPVIDIEITGETAADPGVQHTWLESWFPLRDAGGKIIGLNVVAQDITKRKQAEAALAAHERLLHIVTENARVGLVIVNPEHRYLYANQTFAQVLGLPPRNIIGLRVADVLGELLYQSQIRSCLERAFAGERMHYERSVPPDQGSEGVKQRFVIANYEPYVEDGLVRSVVVAVADITRRKEGEDAVRESEARFRAVADNIPQLAWMADADGNFGWFNQGWLDYTGTTLAQNQGAGWKAVLHPDYVDRVAENLERHVGEGRDWEDTFPLRGKDGQFRFFLSRMKAIRDKGRVVRFFGTSTDVEELRRAEELKQQALVEAEHNARMKDEFLATLSHELRTPMTAVLGWAQLLKKKSTIPGGEKGDLHRGLDIIERNAGLQARIIDDLLDMNAITSGKVRLDFQTVFPNLILHAAADAIRLAAEAKGLRLELMIDPNVGEVRGDTVRLQQVFFNLLTNAVKFTAKGGKIQIVCQRIDSRIEISVSDTGVGIKPEFLPYVFDRFRQQDATTTRSFGGLGLGLAIVKHLVELHGGSVQVASEGDGMGSTFTIQLPVSILLAPSTPDRAGESAETSVSKVELSGVTVLAVDDDPDAREVLRRTLEERGVRVIEAISGAQVMEFLVAAANKRAPRPDVLLFDIGMPIMDGYSLIRAVRALPEDEGGATPAIALTAFARPEDRTRSLLSGFQIHLSKPVELTELLASIASLVGRGGQPNRE